MAMLHMQCHFLMQTKPNHINFLKTSHFNELLPRLVTLGLQGTKRDDGAHMQQWSLLLL